MSRRGFAAAAAGALTVVGLMGATGYVSYRVGGRAGFEEGYLASALDRDAINGAISVKALRSIRAGDHEAATSILETTVDGAVLTYWGYAKLDLSRFDPRDGVRQPDRVFGRIAQYRREYPSTTPYDNVRESVSETVASFPESPSDCRDPKSDSTRPAAQQAAEADGRGLQLRE